MSDYKKLFEEVADFLNKQSYPTVVDQVRVELATGRLSEEKIQTLKEVDDGKTLLLGPEFRKSQAAEFTRRQEYSDADALVLLLEASKRAVVDGAAMAAQIHSALEFFGIKNVIFESESPDIARHELLPVENAPSFEQIKERVSGFDALITQIRSS